MAGGQSGVHDVFDNDGDEGEDLTPVDQLDGAQGAELEPGPDGDGPAGADPNAEAEDDIEVRVDDEPADDANDDAPLDAGDGVNDSADDAGDDGAQDDGATAAAGEDEELDDEAKTYSKAVQKRILREKRATRQAREQGANAVREQIGMRLNAEKDALTTKKMLADVLVVNLEGQITAKKEALKKAKEVGDTDAEVNITGELTDLQRKRDQISENAKAYEQQVAQFDARAQQELQRVASTQNLVPQAQQWIGRNRWFNDPRFRLEAAFIKSDLDQRVAKMGLKPTDPRYYKELDVLITRELPSLRTKVAASYTQQRRGAKPNGAVAPGGRRTGGANARPAAGGKRVVHITAEDKLAMQMFKMDPNNPDHVKEYARNKAARA